MYSICVSVYVPVVAWEKLALPQEAGESSATTYPSVTDPGKVAFQVHDG